MVADSKTRKSSSESTERNSPRGRDTNDIVVPTDTAAHKVLTNFDLVEKILLLGLAPFESRNSHIQAASIEACLQLQRVCKTFQRIIGSSVAIQEIFFLHNPSSLSSEEEEDKHQCRCGGGGAKNVAAFCRGKATCKTELNPILDTLLPSSGHHDYRCARWARWRQNHFARQDFNERQTIFDNASCMTTMHEDLEKGMSWAEARRWLDACLGNAECRAIRREAELVQDLRDYVRCEVMEGVQGIEAEEIERREEESRWEAEEEEVLLGGDYRMMDMEGIRLDAEDMRFRIEELEEDCMKKEMLREEQEQCIEEHVEEEMREMRHREEEN